MKQQQKQDGEGGHGGIFLQHLRLLNIRSFVKIYLVLFKKLYKLLYCAHQGPMVTILTTRFSVKKFYVLRTKCIYIFCTDLKTNSDYFPIQH